MSNFIKKLEFFPVPSFAIVMGFSGLAIVFHMAGHILGLNKTIALVLTVIDTALFVLIFGLYFLKFVLFFKAVKEDFLHKIRINFFAAISISVLLLAIIYKNYSVEFSFYLAGLGIVLHTMLTFYTIAFWINNNFEISHSNPAWFIPVVGNVLIPVSGSGHFAGIFLSFYFAIGMFFWLVLFTITFYRIVFHNQLPQKFMPTLFILIAPPAIGFVAYFNLTNSIDFFALSLYNLALFFSLLILFLYKNFLKLEFFISWWAFTFPVAAVSIATLLMYAQTGLKFYYYSAWVLIGTTCAIVLFVSFKTILHVKRGQFCIKED